jgi:DNA invertase Pin-like site-specific DNA recombinase
MRTILYARVSTAEQTLAHQETQARAAGFNIDDVIADDGVSGITTKLKERPEGRRLYDKLRKGDVLVVRWLDRLGRNYLDVRDAVQEFMARGVTIKTVINAMTFDGATKDPMQMAVRDALIGFMAALGQAQAEATKEAQRAGVAHARANEPQKYLGRKPSYDARQLDLVFAAMESGKAMTEVATLAGVSRQTAYRIKSNPAEARRALEVWGMQ